MQVRCVKAFGVHKPGDTAEVPDGAAVDPEHYEIVAPPAPPPPPASSQPLSALGAVTPKEGM